MNGVSLAGKVQTVLGPIEPEELGVTMTHEHLLSSFEGVLDTPEEASRKAEHEAPIGMDLLGWFYHGQAENTQNFKLDDIPTIIAEVGLYKQFGGSAVVDATNIGLGRDPVGLARISRATGVHVIMGSSFYVGDTHPSGDMDGRSEESLAEQIAGDVLRGVGTTGIRSGIMGEVGCSWPLLPDERKVLKGHGTGSEDDRSTYTDSPGKRPVQPT